MSQTVTSENIAQFETSTPAPAAEAEDKIQQFKDVAETGLQSLKEFAANPEEFMSSEKGQELKSLAENSFGDAKEKLKVLVSDGEKYARENPTKAVLAAVGVGFVLGVLLKR